MALAFFDKEQGAFEYTKEQSEARKALGDALGKMLNKPGALEALGAHVVLARDKGTETQQKRWAKHGRTSMVEVAIPVPALTIEIDGAPHPVSTKGITITLSAVIDSTGPEHTKAEVPAKPAVRALTYADLRAMQNASRAAQPATTK